MVQIKGKTIIYAAPASDQLGQVSPYLLVERLADELVNTWPQVKVNKVFASKINVRVGPVSAKHAAHWIKVCSLMPQVCGQIVNPRSISRRECDPVERVSFKCGRKRKSI